MEFTIKYTLKDYCEIQKAHFRLSLYKKLTVTLGFISILFGIYLLLAGVSDINTLVILFLGLLFLFFERIVLLPRYRKDYISSKYLQGTFKYKLDKDGIRGTNDYVDTKSSWDSFINMKLTNEVILLYKGANAISGFPKHYFKDDEWGKLTEYLKNNIKNS